MTLPPQRVAELHAIADANYTEAFRQAARHANPDAPRIAVFGGAVSIVTGSPGAFFNPVVVTDATVVEDDVRRALAWSRAFDVQPSVHVRVGLEDRVHGPAAELGMTPEARANPVMVLEVGAAVVPPTPPDLSIRVLGPDDLDPWYEAAGEVVRLLIPPVLASDENVRFVTGFVDGRPVSHALALADKGAIGIYAVGTIEGARRRGYGAAVTWSAIEEARKATALDLAILQSSEMGAGVYRAMGFFEVGRYVLFRPAPSVVGERSGD